MPGTSSRRATTSKRCNLLLGRLKPRHEVLEGLQQPLAHQREEADGGLAADGPRPADGAGVHDLGVLVRRRLAQPLAEDPQYVLLVLREALAGELLLPGRPQGL